MRYTRLWFHPKLFTFHRYRGWRPNLPDAGDNHLIELALTGGAQAIVTHNLRDLRGGELQLGTLRVLTPAECLEEWK